MTSTRGSTAAMWSVNRRPHAGGHATHTTTGRSRAPSVTGREVGCDGLADEEGRVHLDTGAIHPRAHAVVGREQRERVFLRSHLEGHHELVGVVDRSVDRRL